MKRILEWLCCLFITTGVGAQTMVESTTYASGEVRELKKDISVVRMINGGTKFLVTYEGTWDNRMKSAFEYACKIWEENLPTMLPIKIKAVVSVMSPSLSRSVLSKITYPTYFWNQEKITSSKIKAVLLMESNRMHNVQFVDSIKKEFFDEYDMVLTYNIGMLGQMSFSLLPSDTEKYDFVTLVLRDIAKGLGINWPYLPVLTGEQTGRLNWGNLSFYERFIADGIYAPTAEERFIKATQGTVNVSIPQYGTLQLYAPSTWQNGVSLNTFVPDESKGLTQLLTYDFGKGTVIRDIRDNYGTFFQYAMGWEPSIAVGGGNSYSDTGISTENVVPYKGRLTVSNLCSESKEATMWDNKVVAKTVATGNEYFDIVDYCKPYNYNLHEDGNIDGEGWTVALLKNDGTWDIVKRLTVFDSELDLDFSEISLNNDITEYARTCDGYLRARVSYSKLLPNPLGGNAYYREGFCRYYVLDYLPQKVEQQYVGRRISTQIPNQSLPVSINIKNLEGVEKVIVEQWEEGEIVPYKFEVPNFKDGYFNATIDSWFDNEFRVISYNKNGSVKSDALVIEGREIVWGGIIMDGNDLIVKPSTDREDTTGKLQRKLGTVSYDIAPVSGFSSATIVSGKCESIPLKIDISSLPAGTYALNLYMKKGKRHSMKFIKK